MKLQVLLGICLIFFSSSCTFNKRSYAHRDLEPLEPENLIHTVAYEGETLGAIASWYTGEFSNWQLIKSFNPGLDEKLIRIGDTIIVPEDLLVRRERLPLDRVKGPAVVKIEEKKLTGHKATADGDKDHLYKQLYQEMFD